MEGYSWSVIIYAFRQKPIRALEWNKLCLPESCGYLVEYEKQNLGNF